MERGAQPRPHRRTLTIALTTLTTLTETQVGDHHDGEEKLFCNDGVKVFLGSDGRPRMLLSPMLAPSEVCYITMYHMYIFLFFLL